MPTQFLWSVRTLQEFIELGGAAIVQVRAALQASEIAGAGLDVFEVEPLPSNHPLWSLPNVILTPHVAGYSPLIAARHLDLLLDNIGRFLRGEPLRNVVDKERWF